MGQVRHHTWQYVIDWTTRMAMNHGGIVMDKSGVVMDWGQALMREVYGSDWMDNPQFKIEDAKEPSEPLDYAVIDAAKMWESGVNPDWMLIESGGNK